MKKVLALLLAVVMVLSASVSVMAFEDVTEENANFEAINYFFENGVVEGDTATGNFNPDNNYKRVEMIKVLVGALGYTEEDATAKAGETAYADLNADEIVSAWASGYVNIATEIGMVEGDNGNLNYNAYVTAGELATMILRVLDVELDETGTPWYADAVAKAVEAGILAEDADGAASMTRGNAMGVMYASLDIENAEGETFRTLIEGEEEVVEPETFEAVSATSVNLGEIDVVFSAPIAKAAANLAGIKVWNGSNEVVVTASVLADGVTVRLAATFAQQKDYKVTVAKTVKSAADVAAPAAELAVVTKDFAIPVLENVEFVGPQTAKLTFSEPVDGATITATLNNGAYVGVVTNPAVARTATVNFGTTLAAATYKVKVSGATDVAGFKMDATEVDVEFAPVATPVKVTVVEATQESVKIAFDRPVSVKAGAENSFYHTYTIWKAAEITPAENVEELTLDFSDNAFVPGEVKLVVLAKDTIVDAWGNKLEAGELTLNIVIDKTAPTVVAVNTVANRQDQLKVVFSEKVDKTKAETAGNYTLTKVSTGLKVTVSTADLNDENDGDMTTVTLTAASDLSGEYVLTVKNVEDEATIANVMADYSGTVTVPDMTPFTTTDFEGTWAKLAGDGKVIYVEYPDAPATSGAYSALNSSNYVVQYLDTDPNPDVVLTTLDAADFKAELFSNTVVKLTVTNTQKLYNADGVDAVTVSIGRVADAAGNYPAEFVLATATAGAVSAPAATKANMVNGNTVTLEIGEELKSIDPSKFYSDNNGTAGASQVAYASFANNNNKAVITLTLRGDENFVGATYSAATANSYNTGLEGNNANMKIGYLEGAFVSVKGVKNEANIDLDEYDRAELLDVTGDKLAPAVKMENEGKKYDIDVVNTDGAQVEPTATTVTVKYTEKLDVDYMSKQTFSVSVNGKAVSYNFASGALGADAANFTLELVKNSAPLALTEGDVIVITQGQAVQDVAGNTYTAASSFTVTYTAA